jgi:hypothetical protein
MPRAISVFVNLRELASKAREDEMRASKTSRLLLAAAFAMTAVAVTAPLAAADAVYHSQHIALNPIGSASLRSGFVENIHADGPQVYAHELYALNGAEPDTTYQVTLMLYPFDPSCLSSAVPIPTARFQTNPAGDGIGQFIFRPGDVPVELRGATHGIRWEVTSGSSTYGTACSSVTLD